MNALPQRTALVVGATGAVGGYCVQELLRSGRYSKVTAITRSPLTVEHPKLEKHRIDFDRLDEHPEFLRADDIFCSLGTIAKKASSRDEYYKVDVLYPHRVAELGRREGASRFFLVTAAGADPASLFYYLRFKGDVERLITSIPFEAVHIFRPGLIMGPRKEFRLSESIAVFISTLLPFLFVGPFARYKPVKAADIARAMVRSAEGTVGGVKVYESETLIGLCGPG